MDRLKAMTVFARVVEARSFSKAAETLSLPASAVTATVKRLETHLGVKLLQRTTRSVKPTAEGDEYYDRCAEILNAVDNLDESLRELSSKQPRGTLRIGFPGALARMVVLPRLAEFRQKYPDLKLLLNVRNRLTDLAQEGTDCVLRVGALQDSSMIGRQVGLMKFVTCASPEYLKRRGVPETIAQLSDHDLIGSLSGRTGRPFDWDFQVDGKVLTIDVKYPVVVDDADSNLLCGLYGFGIVQVGAYQARPYIESGALVELFPDYKPTPMPVSLLYASQKLAPPKIRAFSQWIVELFQNHPDFN